MDSASALRATRLLIKMGDSDIAFTVILLGSIPAAAMFRAVPLQKRAIVSMCIGLAAIVFACGIRDAVHPLVAMLLSIACSRLVRFQWRAAVAFFLAFGHLGFVRMQPTPPGGPTNALLLVLALRLAPGLSVARQPRVCKSRKKTAAEREQGRDWTRFATHAASSALYGAFLHARHGRTQCIVLGPCRQRC